MRLSSATRKVRGWVVAREVLKGVEVEVGVRVERERRRGEVERVECVECVSQAPGGKYESLGRRGVVEVVVSVLGQEVLVLVVGWELWDLSGGGNEAALQGDGVRL